MNKVAVIMSVYRSDKLEHFQEAVNSILTQSFKNLTLFIYRDGKVPSKINEYLFSIESTKIIICTSDSNRGLAYALNALIDTVILRNQFTYIARMDSDDISRKYRIEKQIAFLERDKSIDVCGTSCREFGASFALAEKHLPTDSKELENFSITHCPFIHPSVMFRTSVFISGIRYPTDTSFTEDMALWFMLLNKGFKFSNINEILLDYRLNENTLERRQGVKKAFSEFVLRFKNMLTLKRISIRNVVLVFSRLVFHLLPINIMKFCYKNSR